MPIPGFEPGHNERDVIVFAYFLIINHSVTSIVIKIILILRID